MNKNTKEPIHVENVTRVDGGWWFSETSSEGRHVYTVVDRQLISPDHVLEFLEPLPEDFVQLPCWEEGPQLVQVHRKMNQEHLKSIGDLQVIQWASGELPAWVQEEVGHDSIVQKIMKSMVLLQEDVINSSLTEKHRTKLFHSQKQKYVQQPSQQSQKAPSSFHQPNLKTGQLCPPTFVPETQSSRVLHYQPSKPHKHSSQVDYKKCQILMN